MKNAEELKKIGRDLTAQTESMLGHLYSRWLDEREYEDFQEYSEVMKRNIGKLFPGYEFIKATRRPFGYQVKTEDAKFTVTITTRSINWKCEPLKGKV